VRVIRAWAVKITNLRHFELFKQNHLMANLSSSRLSPLSSPDELLVVVGIALVVVCGGPMVLQVTQSGSVAFVLYISVSLNPSVTWVSAGTTCKWPWRLASTLSRS